jgi:rsbT co-antagonist protein RsbR
MLSRFTHWFTSLPSMSNTLEQQQAPSLQAYMIALTIAAGVWSLLPVLIATTTAALVAGLFAPAIVVAGNIGAIVLLRRGSFRAAVGLSVAVLVLAVAALIWSWGLGHAQGTLTAFSMAITLSGLLMSRRQFIIVASFCAGIAIAAWLTEQFAPALIGFAPLVAETTLIGVATFGLTTFIVVILFTQFGIILRHMLQTSLQRESELEQLRGSLETTIAERTAALQEALKVMEQREEHLSHILREVQSGQDTIRELSAPILPVLPGVLVAPLIGAVDSRRAALFTSNVLSAVEQERAHSIIFDVTGVPVVDTHVARVLIETAAAIRLLGARVLLVGIRPEVAQTLVALNVQFDMLATYSDLREAVAALIKDTPSE